MGAGVDPHLYKATPGDIRLLKSASIVFYNGLHLEGRLADVLEKFADRSRPMPSPTRFAETRPSGCVTRRNSPPASTRTFGSTSGCGQTAPRSPRENWPKSIRHAAGYERRAAAYICLIAGLGR